MPSRTPVAFQISVLYPYPKSDFKKAVAFYLPDSAENPTQFKMVSIAPVTSTEDYEDLAKTIDKQDKESQIDKQAKESEGSGSTWPNFRNLLTESKDSPSSDILSVPTKEEFASWIHQVIKTLE